MAARFWSVRTLDLLSCFGRLGIRRSHYFGGGISNIRTSFPVANHLAKQTLVISKFSNSFRFAETFSAGSTSGKIYIEFTCKKCQTRNKKFMSKVAYNSGVVIITCEGCKNNHLIADNLNWFTDLNGKKNIEDILKEKGESVRKISFSEEGVAEIVTEIKSLE